MSKGKGNREIGDPLEQVALTGKIGRSQTSKSPDIQDVKIPNVQNTERGKSASVQTSELQAPETLKSPDIQKFNHLAIQNDKISDTQTSEMVEVQSAKSPEVPNKKGAHKGRTQKTIYLPPALAKRLNIAAAEEEREISEIVTDALEDYFKKKAKENN